MFLEEVKEHLTGKIIPFWKQLRDDTYGGYYGSLDYDLNLDQKAIKGVILHSRILWFFSNAYLLLQDESLLSEAKHAYEFLRDHAIDSIHGGVYFYLNYDGTPRDQRKNVYNHAFAIYGFTSYYEASEDPEALQLACNLYDILEERCRDGLGYLEEQDEAFKDATSNEEICDHGVHADKTMNTLLHVFEAYTELYRITKSEKIRTRVIELLSLFEQKVYHPSMQRLEVFFDHDWKSLLNVSSYGHDIEASWLLDYGCQVLKDEEWTKRMEPIIAGLAERVYEKGYVNHSVLSECENGVEDTLRIWWVQTEGVTGFLNYYQNHPKETQYKEAAYDIWNFLMTHMVDQRPNSEWYYQLYEDGTVDRKRPIVDPWKCPYHNGRMCMELLKRGVDLA